MRAHIIARIRGEYSERVVRTQKEIRPLEIKGLIVPRNTKVFFFFLYTRHSRGRAGSKRAQEI